MARKKQAVEVRVGTERKTLLCVVCQHDRLFERRIFLPSRIASFLDFEYLGREANCFVCERCLHMHWFARH